MAFTSFVLLALIAGVGRVVLQLHLTGDHGLRRLSRSASITEKAASYISICAGLGMLIFAVASFGGAFQPMMNAARSVEVIGMLLCLTGIGITVSAQWQMGKDWRIGVSRWDKTELVTHGLYRFSRNPIYSGLFIFGCGQVLLLPDPLVLATFCAACLGVHLHVVTSEEPHMTRLHGETFDRYRKRVGRYFPKV